MQSPTFTIVTAVLNAVNTIDRAVASLAGQSEGLQHVVIDGGSTDGTRAACARHAGLELVDAPGSSIYQAWNIGVERARGDFVMFLNADDEMAPDACRHVAEALRRRPDAGIVAGTAVMIDADRPSETAVRMVALPGDRLDTRELALGVPAINAMAFRREVLRRHGPFETAYRVAGDRAFLLHLSLTPEPVAVARAEAILYRYYNHAGSLTLHRTVRQRLRIADEHMALATRMLRGPLDRKTAALMRFWRRREAAAASWACLKAAKPLTALGFVGRLASGR